MMHDPIFSFKAVYIFINYSCRCEYINLQTFENKDSVKSLKYSIQQIWFDDKGYSIVHILLLRRENCEIFNYPLLSKFSGEHVLIFCGLFHHLMSLFFILVFYLYG